MNFLEWLEEDLDIVKMKLPDKTESGIKLVWNDETNHKFFDRIKRAGLERKQTIQKISKAVDQLIYRLMYGGPFVIKFTKSKFYVPVFVNLKKNKSIKNVNIKTILSEDMILRGKDKVLTIKEAEQLFDFDLKEFYQNGFVNSCYGSLLIEESLDRNELEVFVDYIEINS